MSLGLKKFENEIIKAWKSVLDDKDETNWALYGYDGQSNDLKLVSSGKYGLDELQQEINNPGKVFYAFVKVLNPKSNLPILITINWVGEGAPLNRKSNSPNHSIQLQKFFKYSTLTINAREDEEVEPEAILDKIKRSSTTEFNFSSIRQDEILDKATPVSTNHVRIRPEKDLNLKEKTKFWSKLEQEENEKKQEEIKKQKELKLNERNLIKNRFKEKNGLNFTTTNDEQVVKKIDSLKLNNERERFWEQQKQEEKKRREEENRKRLLEKRKIENEIRSLSDAKQIMNAFNTFNNLSSTTQVNKINAIDEINLEKKKILCSIKNSLTNNDKENTEVNKQNENQDDDLSINQLDDLNDEIVIHDEGDESLTENDLRNRTFTREQIQDDQLETEHYYKLQAEYCGNRARKDYLIEQQTINEDEIEIFDQEEEFENEYCLENGLTNYTSYLSKRLSNEPLEDIAEEDEDETELEDQTELSNSIKSKGLCATALFDYQASDDTEISFEPNDIITEIEKVYESWWLGKINDKKGLFPANFVQVLETELN